MRGLYCAFISYTITDIIVALDYALSLGMNPLLMLLMAGCVSLAIYCGIERLSKEAQKDDTHG